MKKRVYLLIIFLTCFIALLLSAVTVSAAEVVDSGACGADGDNLTWTLDSDGVLTISGSGAMEDYNDYIVQPWSDSCEDVKSLKIDSGVTSIEEDAFSCCNNLMSIEVATENKKYDSRNNCNAIIETESNTLIRGCSNTLIPSNVTSIGESAFDGCDSLTSIEIPNGVTSIGKYAFNSCDSLTSIEIPNSVVDIGDMAFSWCSSLKSIEVDKENEKYDSRNNCNAIIETESNTLILGCRTTLIPSSVTSIGEDAFEGCDGLINVEIPSGVKRIEDGAFSGCGSLTNVEIPNTVMSIGDGAFDGCSELTSIEIPNSVMSIGVLAFQSCDSLINIEIPNSVTCIGAWAFRSCDSLISIKIPDSVTSIGEGVFSWCKSLTNIDVDTGNKKYDSRNNCNAIIETKSNTLIRGCSNTLIPSSVTSIGEGAFSGYRSLTNIEIPNGVTSIGIDSFSGCSDLTSVEIPNSVTSIGNRAFSHCRSLMNVEIPNSVTRIGSMAFSDCSALTSIEIPSSVTDIGIGAFSRCKSLTSIEVAIGNKKYDNRNNCNAIIETESNTLISGCSTTFIPRGVTSIGNSAFFECSNLTSIEIPSSVMGIGDWAFEGCEGLTNAVIPNSVTSMGYGVFSGCSGLTSVAIPYSLTNIAANVFQYCDKLTDVYYGGTEGEWKKLSIKNGNDVLNTANIHFTEYVESIEIIENTSENVSVNVHNLLPSQVYLAIYDSGGKLLKIFEKAVPARAETAKFPLEGVDLPEEYSVKAFMLSENDLIPTVEASEL